MVERGWRLVRFAGGDQRPRLGAIDPREPTRVIEIFADSGLDGDFGGLIAMFGSGPERLRNAVTRSVEAALRKPRRLPDAAIVDIADPYTLELMPPWRLLAPVVAPETWAAGVTYAESKDGRLAESEQHPVDVYNYVYEAERPELFLKDSCGRRTVGPEDFILLRSDSVWTVPEPELALILGANGALIGATAGNDVTARDIEGENPLYLPQAKIFARSCALGPAVLLPDDWGSPFDIKLKISNDAGAITFEGATTTALMRRSFTELAASLVADNPVPIGTVLLTGTGIVPPPGIALGPGDVIEISIDGIGVLRVTAAGSRLEQTAETTPAEV
jgi:2-dehydro-3-deoxy-D-arabinonate dehydratase